jgi:hypothetical protein
MAVAARETARVRALVTGSATAALVGIALAVSGEQAAGGWLTVLALLGLIWGVHKLGRLGADEV